MKNFIDLESRCSLTFRQSGPYWHLWTSENHQIIFQDKESFIAGVNILAICSRLIPDVKIITFQLMSNHLHLTLSGLIERILLLFELFKRYLGKYLKGRGISVDLSSFEANFRELSTLQELRNVITYNNRNGYVVTPDSTPFTYPWGANAYYYNDFAKSLYRESQSVLSKAERRSLIHSHDSDKLKEPIIKVDGYACPMNFCCVTFGEAVFRCASHYFREISRNIESQKDIAKELGERIFYSDDELFSVVLSICKDKYGGQKPSLIPAVAKSEVALLLHNEYNASNKQIQRMLRLEASFVDSLFPKKN